MQGLIQQSKEVPVIRRALTMRCTVCGKYIKGDPYVHLREVHGGVGTIQNGPSLDQAMPTSSPSQAVIQLVDSTTNSGSSTSTAISNPFITQYDDYATIPSTTAVQQASPSFSFFRDFQHPAIARLYKMNEAKYKELEAQKKLLELKKIQIDQEKTLIDKQKAAFADSNGALLPLDPGSWEEWQARLSHKLGVQVNFKNLVIAALFLYVVIISFGIDTWIASKIPPMISPKGIRLLEERGHVIQSPFEYEELVKAEWRNVHENLKRLDAHGNEKLPVIKLRIKTHLMGQFPSLNLDQAYIMLRDIASNIDSCYSIALVNNQKYPNQFTDAFIKCMLKFV